MFYIASFDIGTTAVKGVIVDLSGHVINSKSLIITTVYKDEYIEQDPNEWYRLFCTMSKELIRESCNPSEIRGIIMSGQMQDLIMVDDSLNPIMNAILYSDNRGEVQANNIKEKIGEEALIGITGNSMNGTLPFAKLLWIKENKPSIYKKVHKILFSSKDYCVGKLTGTTSTDPTSASTSGLMNIDNKCWQTDFLNIFDINDSMTPEIKFAHEIVGYVSEIASNESGYDSGTPVYCGSGDAGATTLASGISKVFEFNINLGTSGWVACVSDGPIYGNGIFNLAAIPSDVYVNVVPFINAGSVHKWITSIVSRESENGVEYVDDILKESNTGSDGLLFLPYLSGERFPVIDSKTKACFIGLTPETTKSVMVRACLEGVAFSIRQGIEKIAILPNKVSIVGGGAKNSTWCQIFADMLNIDVEVYAESEYMPAISLASAVLYEQGLIDEYSTFIDKLLEKQGKVTYQPNKNSVEILNVMYNRYRQIYDAVKGLFY